MSRGGRRLGRCLSVVVMLTAYQHVGLTGAQPARNPPRYADAIEPLLAEHCVTCHRPGGLGPFSLIGYEAARERAAAIASATGRRTMPPWKPVEPVGVFQGERRLTAAQIDLLARWAAAGAPEGPPSTRSAVPLDADGWSLGPPDLVLTLPEPFVVPAGTTDAYRKFVLAVPIDEQRWIRALEVRPGSSGAIHHARVMVDTTGGARHLDAADPLPGYDGYMMDSAEFPHGHVLGWAPGKMTVAQPDRLSWPLAPGTDLVVQLHVLPRSEPVSVQPELGLYYAKAPATQQPVAMLLNALTIDIPAGDARHVVRDSLQLPVAVDVLSIYPHAHYLAKEIHATAALPDRSERTLLRIDQWDYNWQDEYRYTTPVHLPAGTRVEMRYVYDNSAANPHNPHHPPQPVRSGPKATDEMAQLMLQVLTVGPGDRDTLIRALRAESARDDVAAHEARLRRNPDDYESLTAVAVRHLEAGKIDAALTALQVAIRARPEYADAHYNLGAALFARGAVRDAIAAYRKATELDPAYAQAHNNLGVLLETVGDRTGAIVHYERAIALQPRLADAHENLASALLGNGQLGEAIDHFERALASEPRRATSRAGLAHALTQVGRRADAVADYQRALAVDPTLASALLGLAWLRATAPEPSLRNADEALGLVRRAAPLLGENHPAVLDTLAAAYAAQGRFDRAVDSARRAADRARAHPELGLRAVDVDERLRLYRARQPYRLPQ